MYTIWVKSNSTPRPRRTHRWRPGTAKTECGLYAYYMQPVTTNKVRKGVIPPQFCHVCFKYRYRFLSRPKQWRHQMVKVHPNLLKNSCQLHGIFEGDVCPLCVVTRGPVRITDVRF